MEFHVMRPPGGLRFGLRYAHIEPWGVANYNREPVFGHCPECGGRLGMLHWLPPHQARLSRERYSDVVWGVGVDFVVSERFLEAYRAHGMKGIVHVDPQISIVRVGKKPVDRAKIPPPVCHNTRYLYGGATVDWNRSEAKENPRSGACRFCMGIDGVERIVLEPESWSGADIFCAYALSPILVTNRFRRMCEEAGFENLEFIPADQYRIPSWKEREEALTQVPGALQL